MGEAVVLCCVDDGEVLLTSVGVGLVDDVSAVEPESMDNKLTCLTKTKQHPEITNSSRNNKQTALINSRKSLKESQMSCNKLQCYHVL